MPDFPSRRRFLGLSLGSLTLPHLLRLRAAAGDRTARDKAVIMVYLNGGPSHIDLYDPKPNAPVEYRGEFRPIPTNVPGVRIGELLPLQAKIADKLAIVRNMVFKQEGHTAPELYTGFLGKAHEAYTPGLQPANLGLARDMTADRLGDRRGLLHTFDAARRELDDPRGS